MLPRCSASLRRKRSALWADLLRIHWRALRPSKPPSNKKERLYEAVSELSLAFSGRALAPLPHPPRASTKTKTWLWMVEVGPAFVPECRVVRDRTERPQDEHGAMPPAPRYPKCVYGHSATGPRVMNPFWTLLQGVALYRLP